MRAEWKTQDGRTIAVKDMDSRHLLNTIKMLERNAPVYKDNLALEGYKALTFIQGEQAEWDIERDLGYLEAMSIQEFIEEYMPILKTMKWHAKRRKLDIRSK